MLPFFPGHVGISARHSNHFRVSVNTEAKSNVVFFLLYEELLHRRSGRYEHVINLTPRQKLKDFDIEVDRLTLQKVGSSFWLPLSKISLLLSNSEKGKKKKAADPWI